ncbi:signal peptide peptidase-like 2B isoform X1 [Onychomys torridus]|uniref:signal peptide peptidase-like 2B isoform X1 n=1 Tax=Onychomys torridus TaxID=38674 RepID=UPI00167F3B79|nr:signal peptide peptidase-like 2B isoform X1 [Onychomys torridus]
MAAARLAAALLLLTAQVACEFGVLRVVSQSSSTRGRDYCILYNPQWAHLPHDLSKVVSCPLEATLEATCACGLLLTPILQPGSCHSPGSPWWTPSLWAWVFMLRSKKTKGCGEEGLLGSLVRQGLLGS